MKALLEVVRVGVSSFASDDAGVTVIEYALLGGLIIVVAVVGIGATGADVVNLWTRISSYITSAING